MADGRGTPADLGVGARLLTRTYAVEEVLDVGDRLFRAVGGIGRGAFEQFLRVRPGVTAEDVRKETGAPVR